MAIMDPQQHASTVIMYLEQKGVVGALLPSPSGGRTSTDRYQPHRVSLRYTWEGNDSAATSITFKIHVSGDRDDVVQSRNGWSISSRPSDEGWGAGWEDITIEIPSARPEDRQQEFYEPGRFRVSVSINDNQIAQGVYDRTIVLENRREQGGMLHSIRIVQRSLPLLRQVRPYGVGDDIYYRAGGLVASRNAEGDLVFAPHALLPEPVRRPKIGTTLVDAVTSGLVPSNIAEMLSSSGFTNLYDFQSKSISELSRRLSSEPEPEALLLTGGTASGKTEAFLIPLLKSLEIDKDHLGVKGLFVYPMKALEADQARRFFEYLAKFNTGRQYPISIGVWDGDTPFNRDTLIQLEEQGRLRTPFSECPVQGCNGTIRFTISTSGQRLDKPQCSKCNETFPWLRVSRSDIQDYWPHILLTVPDMLHRAISDSFAWSNQCLFGRSVHYCQSCRRYSSASTRTLDGRRSDCNCGTPFQAAVSLCPDIIVFDEAHLLKGLFGSQVAILIARIRQIATQTNHFPVFVGVSATVASPEDFGRQLFETPVKVIIGQDEIIDTEPTRYHLFVMPVQVTVLNAVGHVLAGCFKADKEAEEGKQNRVLVFSDAKRTVYQLESSLHEFYATLSGDIIPTDAPPPPTASHTADLSSDERRQVEDAFDSERLRVLLATQTLEVGVDFRALQLEVQTGATYSYNDYIQRVGRAGRKGIPALVICVLRPQVPLDYYYFEHCRELVQFLPETLDEVPLRSDNPFLVDRHTPAAIQDYLIGASPGARLMWFLNDAIIAIKNSNGELRNYLERVFIGAEAWDEDLIRNALNQATLRTIGVLEKQSSNRESTSDRLKQLISLSIRATDVSVGIRSDDFTQHEGISSSFDLGEDDQVDLDVPDFAEEVND